MRGKRLYYDIASLTSARVSCVECHGAYPGAAHGIGRAADDPRAIRYALGAVPQMGILAPHLGARELADIAAYLGAPAIAAPQPVLLAEGRGPDRGAQGRLEIHGFPGSEGGASAAMRLENRGNAPLRVRAAPEITGAAAARFRLLSTDCLADLVLSPGQFCRIEIMFTAGAEHLATATLVIPHDWLRGGENIALIGYSRVPEGDKKRRRR